MEEEGKYMSKKLVTDLDVSGKKVLVRVDFNVPHKGNVISDDNRITSALKTINYLLKHHAKVILFSHLGKINHKDETKTNIDKQTNDMVIVANRLKELLPGKVKYVPYTRGKELEEAIDNLKDGEALLMQNTRYEKGETKNDPELSAYWASLADLYVTDAFGTLHRAHASNVGTAALLPNAIGFLVEKELNALSKNLNDPRHPFVAILGGAKVYDKIGVTENLVKIADKVLVGGGMAFTFLKAQGIEVGKSLVEDDKLEVANNCLKKANGKLILPIDAIVADSLEEPKDIKVVDIDKIPNDYMGLDIGPKTILKFKEELKDSKTVFWNGPMGVFEKEAFKKGTMAICEAIAELDDCNSTIGGGDSVSAAKASGYADRFSHISTGGGASLEFMEGKELPGVAVIEEK